MRDLRVEKLNAAAFQRSLILLQRHVASLQLRVSLSGEAKRRRRPQMPKVGPERPCPRTQLARMNRHIPPS